MKTLTSSPCCFKLSKLGLYSINDLPPCGEGNIIKWVLSERSHFNMNAIVFISPDQIKDLIDLLNEAYEEIQKV